MRGCLLWFTIILLVLSGCVGAHAAPSNHAGEHPAEVQSAEPSARIHAVSRIIEPTADCVIVQFQTDVMARMTGHYCSGDQCGLIAGSCSEVHVIELPRWPGVTMFEVTVTFYNDCQQPVTKEFCVFMD